MTIQLLIIDDHPSIIFGYKMILSFNALQHTFKTVEAQNCKEAFDIITKNPTPFDLVLLDYSLPAYPEEKLLDGGDIAKLIRKHLPEAKIIIITSHSEIIKLNQIVEKTRPNGLLLKSNVDDITLLAAYERVLNGEYYYCKTVIEAKKNHLIKEGLLSRREQEIIQQLNQGFQIKTIAENLCVSEDTIKKDKSKIKTTLGVDGGGDEDILKIARTLFLI